MSLPEPLRAALWEQGYDPKHIFNFGYEEPEELNEWLHENKIGARWIDIKFEFGSTVFVEDEGRALLYVMDDNQYILVKMRWS